MIDVDSALGVGGFPRPPAFSRNRITHPHIFPRFWHFGPKALSDTQA